MNRGARMKQGAKMDVRGIVAAVAGGGILMLVAAQILAKPGAPPIARAVPRDGASAAVTRAPGSRRGAAVPQPLRLAGQPPLRELFRPLVSTEKEQASTGSTPRLPAVTAAAAAQAVTPAPAAGGAPTPPAPVGVQTSDLQMLGVVDLGGAPKALIKRGSTGESRYYAKGEDLYGFKVDEIKDTSVTVTRQGKTDRISMSDAVTIEGPGSISTTGSSGFSGGGASRDRGSNRGSGAAEGGFSTASIMSLPTWTERLKKLEEVKAQVEPEKYERLHKFMASKAEEEKQGKK